MKIKPAKTLFNLKLNKTSSVYNVFLSYKMVMYNDWDNSSGGAFGTKLHNHWTSQTNVIGKRNLWDLCVELGFFIVTASNETDGRDL